MTTLTHEVADLIGKDNPDAGARFLRAFGNVPDNAVDEVAELNRYWRSQLLDNVRVNTTSERECLIDAIRPEDWLRHFKSHVLPTIRRFQLPAQAVA